MRVSEWILLNCRFAQARSVMITPGDIKHWSAYAQKISFGSEQEARDWIFRKLELAEQGSMGEVFGRKGLEYNRQYANQFPVYQSGKTTWKIGKPVRGPRNVLRLSDLEVRRPGTEELYHIARATTEGEYETTGIQWVPLREILSGGQDIYSYGQQEERIRNLAAQIRQNKWIEAIVIAVTSEGKWIIEGQHRARAMAVLGFKTIPAVGIVYDDRETIAWVHANCRFAQSVKEWHDPHYSEPDEYGLGVVVPEPNSSIEYTGVAHGRGTILWAMVDGEILLEPNSDAMHEDRWEEMEWKGRFEPDTGDLSITSGIVLGRKPPPAVIEKLRQHFNPRQIYLFL